MTFKQKMIELMVNNGLFNTQAEEIAKNVIEEEVEMKGRWNDDISGYPEVMVNILWIVVKRHVLKWIEEKMPMHWAKPMFE